MPFETAADLKRDALSLAGEPHDGSSLFDDDVYGLLTSVQNSLISGGPLGPSFMQPMDWMWARAYPRGVMQLLPPVNADGALTVTLTHGSKVVAVSGGTLADNVANDVLLVEGIAVRARILESTPTSITLRDPWPDADLVTPRWVAYRAEHRLPADFVRFASPIFVSGQPYRLDVVSPEDMERRFPGTLVVPGYPVAAAQVTDTLVRFSHYIGTDTPGLQVEFEYIARPEPIDEGVTPRVPYEHRRVLSYGAAYLIMDDKSDSDRDRMFARFTGQYKAMQDEHRRNMSRGSATWGVVLPRAKENDNGCDSRPYRGFGYPY